MRNIFDLIKKKDEEEKEREEYDDCVDEDGEWESASIPMSDDDILIATDNMYNYYLKIKGGELESNLILRKKK